MNILQRVKEILVAPKRSWPVIETEQTGVTALYTRYLMILALIPAIAGLVGMSLIGVSILGKTVRIPLLSGFLSTIVSYVLSLVLIYGLALIADKLAPHFGGTRNRLNALKLIAYSSTAGMVGGIFSILPTLSVLGLLTALYSLYLLFVGAPVMMKIPQEKASTYTAVLLVCGLVAGALLGMASAIFR